MMQTNINVQTLLTEAILTENRDRVYHAAMIPSYRGGAEYRRNLCVG